MKNKLFLRCTLLALVVISFFACDNEPLEGEFVVDDGIEAGSFIANVDGVDFSASATAGVMNDGSLIISGTDQGGNAISLAFSVVGECTYDLSSILNFGAFAFNGEPDGAFVSSGTLGGSGNATITSFDGANQTVTGTFAFTGVRQVTDANGDTITEQIIITNGIFNTIPFELTSGNAGTVDCDEINNGGGGGQDPVLQDPEESFFARANGIDFEDIELTSELIMNGSQNVLKIVATDALGARVELLIPEQLEVGTYDMEPIFNGMNLVGSYNGGQGGENLTSMKGSMTILEFGKITGKFQAAFNFLATDPLGDDPSMITIDLGEVIVDYLPDSGVVENTFEATIDGEEYLSETIEITKQPIGGFTVVNLTTVNTTENRSLSISFPIDIAPGSYAMAPFVEVGDEKVGTYNPDIGNSILFKSDETGTLLIKSYQYSNGVIEAEFSFIANDPLGNITTVYTIEGSFNITVN